MPFSRSPNTCVPSWAPPMECQFTEPPFEGPPRVPRANASLPTTYWGRGSCSPCPRVQIRLHGWICLYSACVSSSQDLPQCLAQDRPSASICWNNPFLSVIAFMNRQPIKERMNKRNLDKLFNFPGLQGFRDEEQNPISAACRIKRMVVVRNVSYGWHIKTTQYAYLKPSL